MKKLLLLLIIPLFFSCNKKITLCDCTDIILEAYFTPVRIDEDLGVILREKYGNKIDDCEKIFEPFLKDQKLIEEKIYKAVSYTHLRAHETSLHLVCRLLLEKKK